jgi:hypothetical protein
MDIFERLIYADLYKKSDTEDLREILSEDIITHYTEGYRRIVYDSETSEFVYREPPFGGGKGVVDEKYFVDKTEHYTVVDCADSANFGDRYEAICKRSDGVIVWGRLKPEILGVSEGATHYFNIDCVYGIGSVEHKITDLLQLINSK